MDRVNTRYNWKDLVYDGLTFSGVEIKDAGSNAFYFPDFHTILEDGFTLNTAEDGSGIAITDFVLSEKNEQLTRIYGKNVYEKIQITNATYQTGSIYAFGYYAGDVTFAEYFNSLQGQIDALSGGISSALIGSIHYFSTYKDRSAYGLLAFDFDNAISQANYPKLFEEIGHIYNDQHVAAGDADLSGSSTLFYPTPVPGAYDRVAIPDSGDIDSTSAIDTGNDTITLSQADYNKFKRMKYYSDSYNGVPVYLKLDSGSLPAGLSEGTIYYLRFTDDANYYAKLYISEANAIDDTSAVDITATATGTFRLTQEGINLDDAFQGHWHDLYGQWNTSGGGAVPNVLVTKDSPSLGEVTLGSSIRAKTVLNDTKNGTPRTTNETRPKTNFLYGYIKAEYVTTAGEPISALREIITLPIPTYGSTVVINHNLNCLFDELIIDNIYWINSGVKHTIVKDNYNSAATEQYGYGFNNIGLETSKTQFNWQVGSSTLLYFNSSGDMTGIGTTGSIEIHLTKPNLVSTIFDVSSLPKTYDLTSGDVTVTLPEITGAMQTKSIYWTNGGTYKLRIKDADDNYLDYEGEGEGNILLESDGSNWQVREYEDTGSSRHLFEPITSGDFEITTTDASIPYFAKTITSKYNRVYRIRLKQIYKGATDGGYCRYVRMQMLINETVVSTDLAAMNMNASSLPLWYNSLYCDYLYTPSSVGETINITARIKVSDASSGSWYTYNANAENDTSIEIEELPVKGSF